MEGSAGDGVTLQLMTEETLDNRTWHARLMRHCIFGGGYVPKERKRIEMERIGAVNLYNLTWSIALIIATIDGECDD